MESDIHHGLKEAYAILSFPIRFNQHPFTAAIEEISTDPLNALADDLLSVLHLSDTGIDAALTAIPDIFSDDTLKYFVSVQEVERSIGSFIEILTAVLRAQLPSLPLREIKSIRFTEPSTFSILLIAKDSHITHWLSQRPGGK